MSVGGNYKYTNLCHILAMATIHGWRLFHSNLPIVVATIRGWRLIDEIRYIQWNTVAYAIDREMFSDLHFSFCNKNFLLLESSTM